MTIIDAFHYSAREEETFDAHAEELGYKRISTFYADLSIAEYYQLYANEKNAIKDTFNQICEEWLGEYKMFTEFVLSLNWKIWKWYEQNEALAREYNTLWEKAERIFYERYKDNETAMHYFYEITD